MYMLYTPIIIMVITIIINVTLVLRTRRLRKPPVIVIPNVKVAASGNGRVYHKLHCDSCINGHEVTLSQAEYLGYKPCATCGGHD